MRAMHKTIMISAVVLLLAGCGSVHRPAVPTAVMMQTGLAQIWDAVGRPTLVSSRCDRKYCTVRYDYTPPDGYRREYTATMPMTCAKTCVAQWHRFHVRRIVRKIGLDPDYPVGECAHALDVYIGGSFTDTPAQRARALRTESLACAGVHKGVYTGPLLTAPGG